jgi:F0F1-type ATP synthase delta subunit
MELEIPHLDNPAERRKLIQAISIFRKLRKISRTRAEKLFARSQHGLKESAIVIGQDIEASEEKYLLSLFEKTFPNAPKPPLSINPNLLGGVRMSHGDEMVELTLNQIKV